MNVSSDFCWFPCFLWLTKPSKLRLSFIPGRAASACLAVSAASTEQRRQQRLAYSGHSTTTWKLTGTAQSRSKSLPHAALLRFPPGHNGTLCVKEESQLREDGNVHKQRLDVNIFIRGV